MPYLTVPARGVKLFYLCNPPERLRYQSIGPEPTSTPIDPNKPTIVFLHAPLTSVGSWTNQLSDQRLRSNFNLIALDSRFHGRSTGEELGEDEEYTLENAADCLMSALDQMCLPSYSIFGESSTGCSQAIWIAHKRPNKVRCLILASPCPHTQGEKTVQLLWKAREALLEIKPGHGGDDSGTIGQPSVLFVESSLGTSERLADRREDYREHLQGRYGTGQPAHDLDRVVRLLAGRKPIPTEIIKGISIPVLLFEGSDDQVMSPKGAAASFADLFTSVPGGAHVQTIQSAPHALAFTDPNIVNRVLLAFVSRNSKGPGQETIATLKKFL